MNNRFLTLESARQEQLEAEAGALNLTSGMVYLGLAVAALFVLAPLLEKGMDAYLGRRR